MSSVFEEPPSPPRSRLPAGLPQLAAAFAAGIVVAVAIARPGPAPEKIPPGLPGASSPTATSSTATTARTVAKREEPAAAQPQAVRAPTPPAAAAPPVRAEMPPPAETAKPADPVQAATKQATDCGPGQWPYLDAKCAEGDANAGERQKSIRVIGVDQTAPASIVAESKPQPAPTVSTAKNESAGAAPIPSAPALTLSNDVAAPSVQAAVALSAAAAAAQPLAAELTPSAPPPVVEVVRIPAPDPRTQAKTEADTPAKAARAPREKVRRETTEREAIPERVTKQKPERDEVAERPARRGDADRSARRDDADKQPRRADIEDRNEAEGFSIVRRHMLPDGRRVTVYRRYDNDNDGYVPRTPSNRAPFDGLFGEGN
jgi:hypothetical protein